MPGYYVIHKNVSNLYHFVLKADNNEVILTSETYTSKGGGGERYQIMSGE